MVAALLSLLAIMSIAASRAGAEPGFTILNAATRLVDGVHRLDASIGFNFSADAIEAMDNGVAVTISVEMEVLELGALWDRDVASVHARYRIQVHALSRQYLVRNLSTGETQTYHRFEDMADGLGRIEGFPLLDDHVLEKDADYRVRLRASLDIESLPTPLRLLAYFKSAWRLSSEWSTWPLQR
jgi:hypothetical protein